MESDRRAAGDVTDRRLFEHVTQASKTSKPSLAWRSRGFEKSGTLITAGVGTSVLLGLLALAMLPPQTACSSDATQPTGQYWFRAVKTVVEPWRGPHHVYGIFTIPEKYKFDHLYTAKLTIQGMATAFQAGSPEDEDMSSGRAEPGYYIKRVYLSTRTALWFLLTGRFGDLRTSCHWWLIVADRGWMPTGK